MKPVAMKLDLKRKLSDLSNPTLEALHCPACFELPRTAPIYNCTRGHLICSNCKPRVTIILVYYFLFKWNLYRSNELRFPLIQVSACPLCRCGNIGQRNQFAERLLAKALDGLVLDCKNKGEGCTCRDLAVKVAEHEKICVYREVNYRFTIIR